MTLDLLRLADAPLPTSVVCAAGEILGFAVGTTRVALTRLVRDEKIMRDEHGQVRLAPRLDALTAFINAWRDGDRRMQTWKGDWLCVWHPRGSARTERSRSLRALDRFGFREGLDSVWIRPNNLAAPLPAVRERLHQFDLVAEARVFVASQFENTDEWANLWPLAELEVSYRRSLRNVRRSSPRLASLSVKRAAFESYHIGDETVHLLAFDPLLPEEILRGDTRRALTAEMIEYRETAGAVWSQLLAKANRRAA
jgi:phenylacetic acid degradation operon negative regulatory protein